MVDFLLFFVLLVHQRWIKILRHRALCTRGGGLVTKLEVPPSVPLAIKNELGSYMH